MYLSFNVHLMKKKSSTLNISKMDGCKCKTTAVVDVFDSINSLVTFHSFISYLPEHVGIFFRRK